MKKFLSFSYLLIVSVAVCSQISQASLAQPKVRAEVPAMAGMNSDAPFVSTF